MSLPEFDDDILKYTALDSQLDVKNVHIMCSDGILNRSRIAQYAEKAEFYLLQKSLHCCTLRWAHRRSGLIVRIFVTAHHGNERKGSLSVPLCHCGAVQIRGCSPRSDCGVTRRHSTSSQPHSICRSVPLPRWSKHPLLCSIHMRQTSAILSVEYRIN